GNLALEAAAKAPPDGYTLLVGNVSTNAINENIYREQLTIQPSRDLVGITKLVEIPHIVVASASFPANSIAELIAAAKKEPGKIHSARRGGGTPPPRERGAFKEGAGHGPPPGPEQGRPRRGVPRHDRRGGPARVLQHGLAPAAHQERPVESARRDPR